MIMDKKIIDSMIMEVSIESLLSTFSNVRLLIVIEPE